MQRKKKKTEKCRIDAYNATFPSCFTISQVLTLSPMKEKNIYKQHIDRRALNIWFVFFSFLIRNSYSTQPELFSFEDMRRRTMVLSRDPSSGVVRQGSKEKFIGKSADSRTKRSRYPHNDETDRCQANTIKSIKLGRYSELKNGRRFI